MSIGPFLRNNVGVQERGGRAFLAAGALVRKQPGFSGNCEHFCYWRVNCESREGDEDDNLITRSGSAGTLAFLKNLHVIFFFLRFCLFIFRKTEKCQCVVASHVTPLGTWPATQACALTGDRTSDPLVCRLTFSPLSPTSEGRFAWYLMAPWEP